MIVEFGWSGHAPQRGRIELCRLSRVPTRPFTPNESLRRARLARSRLAWVGKTEVANSEERTSGQNLAMITLAVPEFEFSSVE